MVSRLVNFEAAVLLTMLAVKVLPALVPCENRGPMRMLWIACRPARQLS
jgi:hypothetical protein